MKRFALSLALLMVALLFVTPAFAQTDDSANDDDGNAADAPAAFITMNLEAGFALDPFFVSVNGGGDVDASTLGEGCVGYVAEAPTVTVEWSGEADFVETFFYSDHDPVLVIETPSGEYLCSDDANEVLLDPVIQMDNPENGRYNIWVGSFDEGQLIPGILVLTTRSEVNIGAFSLGELVHRDAIPEDNVEAEELRSQAVETLAEAQGEAEIETRTEETDTLVADVVADGEFPAFDVQIDEVLCNGYISAEPAFAFSEDGNGDVLRVFVESETDTTIFLARSTDQVWCNDDAEPGVNLNPLIEIENPEAGEYFVYVGRLSLDEPVSGTLTVTEKTDLMPAELAPVAPEATE